MRKKLARQAEMAANGERHASLEYERVNQLVFEVRSRLNATVEYGPVVIDSNNSNGKTAHCMIYGERLNLVFTRSMDTDHTPHKWVLTVRSVFGRVDGDGNSIHIDFFDDRKWWVNRYYLDVNDALEPIWIRNGRCHTSAEIVDSSFAKFDETGLAKWIACSPSPR